ncbi:MAG: riboflavin kinase [Nanoarchaeota archaeon]|nr:riboflavin kinase [Nanoarchaeota archaeon]
MINFSGRVRRGAGRGRALGFPTANVPAPSGCEDGVYVARASFDEKTYSALCFVGIAEMFGEKDRQAEVYILDFDGDLYGKEIRIDVLKKIRESKKFDSKEELTRAMKEDLRIAREYFKVSSCLLES